MDAHVTTLAPYRGSVQSKKQTQVIDLNRTSVYYNIYYSQLNVSPALLLFGRPNVA